MNGRFWMHHFTLLLGGSSLRRGEGLRCCLATILFATCLLPSPNANAQESTGEPNRWLLLACGLTGDDTHREKMTDAMSRIGESAASAFGIEQQNQIILSADEQMQSDLSQSGMETEVCTSESVQQSLEQLSSTLKESDSVVVVLIGHAHLNSKASQFNVFDADFDQNDFATWTEALPCREQIYILTQPLSGFWIRPLRKPGRIIMTATEADLEFTGTEMPYALADVVEAAGEGRLADVDGDDRVSLLDLYLAVNLNIEERFAVELDRIQTEHAQLEDNGDGRGTEVQQPYLPVRETEEEEEDAEEPDEDKADEDDTDKDDADDEVADTAEAEDLEEDQSPVEVARPDIITSRNLDGYRSRMIVLPNQELEAN